MNAVGVGKIGLQVAVPIAASAVAERHRAVNRHTRKRGLAFDLHRSVLRIRCEGQHHGFEINQQTVWCAVVGTQGLAVKVGRSKLWQLKHAVVQNNVTRDAAHTQDLQGSEVVLDALQHPFRVATAANDQITVQNALTQAAVGVKARFPGEIRPQHVERRKSGH